MTLHLIKLSVGSESLESLGEWQKVRIAQRVAKGQPPHHWHRTRMFPRRREELLNGGSIYWVIKGVILGRQKLLDLRAVTCEDGIERCEFVLDTSLVAVRPTPRRPFQGWRYLKGEDAPADLSAADGDAFDKLPVAMRRELVELGLI